MRLVQRIVWALNVTHPDLASPLSGCFHLSFSFNSLHLPLSTTISIPLCLLFLSFPPAPPSALAHHFEFQLNPSAPFHLLSGGRPRPPCNMSVWRKSLTALKGRSPFRHPHSLEGDCHIEGYLFYCPHLYSVVKKFFNVFISSPYSDYYEQF